MLSGINIPKSKGLRCASLINNVGNKKSIDCGHLGCDAVYSTGRHNPHFRRSENLGPQQTSPVELTDSDMKWER